MTTAAGTLGSGRPGETPGGSAATRPQSSGAHDLDAGAWRPRVNPWIITVTVTLATFMEVLDTSIANVALPHIAGNLAASTDEATWVLTSYLVANAIVLPLAGWMSRLMGRKRYYMSCVALFTISSALCGLAPSLGVLIFFRVLQGIGGGGLQPSEQSILADTFAPSQRGMAFAVYGVAVVCAPALGPTLGGWITDNFSWRWIFYINVPVGLLSLTLTSLVVEDPPYEKAHGLRGSGGIDGIGLGLIALGLGCLQVMLDKGQEDDWLSSNFIRVMAVLAAVGILGAIAWELNHKNPIVDLHLLRERNFAVSMMLMFSLGVVLLASTVLMPLFLQTLLGYDATLAGLALTPGAVVIMLILPLVGWGLSRVQAKHMIILGLGISAYGLYRMSNWSLDLGFHRAVVDRIVQASGLAFLFVPINTAAYMYLPPGANNNASGLINLARNIGGGVGISIMATVLARNAQVHQTYLAAHVTPYSAGTRHLLNAVAATYARGGSGAPLAARQAMGTVYGIVQQQATMLAIVDDLRLMTWAFVAIIPLALLLKHYNPRQAKVAAH